MRLVGLVQLVGLALPVEQSAARLVVPVARVARVGLGLRLGEVAEPVGPAVQEPEVAPVEPLAAAVAVPAGQVPGCAACCRCQSLRLSFRRKVFQKSYRS